MIIRYNNDSFDYKTKRFLFKQQKEVALQDGEKIPEEEALLYPRVSTKRQELEGNGLESQEVGMRAHCKLKNLPVAGVFPDTFTGEGDFWSRPAMRDILDFIDKNPRRRFVVIFDDLKRLARDVVFHWKLREAFASRGVRVECLNFRFEDTPEGRFIETVIAANGQLEREQNKRQVNNRMQVWIEKGYFLGKPPLGFRVPTSEEKKGGTANGQKLPDWRFPLVREAFELFDTGNYSIYTLSIEMGKRGLTGINGKPITPTTLETVLKSVFYIQRFIWAGVEYKGNHERCISDELFNRVQVRLKSNRVSGSRSHNYLLKKKVKCGCGYFLSPSKHKKYVYLECKRRGGCGASTCWVRGRKAASPRVDDVLDLISQSMFRLELDKNFLERVRRDLKILKKQARNENKKAWEESQKQLKILDQKVDRLENGYDEGVYTAERFKEKRKMIEDERAKIYERLKEDDLNANRAYLDAVEKFIFIGKALTTHFELLKKEEQRKCIELFFENVEIQDEDLHCEYSELGKYLFKRKFGKKCSEPQKPPSLSGKTDFCGKSNDLVEHIGLEPMTSCMPCKRSSQLS